MLNQITEEGKVINKFGSFIAWESLRFAIDLMQQIRNTGNEIRDTDFILSPVRNNNGENFDSREYLDKEKNGEKIELPSSGDANGAFNIARKGILMNRHIQKDWSLFIADAEWDCWLAGEEIWQSWIKKNEKDLEKKKIKQKE